MHRAPVVVRHAGEQAVARQARVVDEDVRGRPPRRQAAERSSGEETSAWTARAAELGCELGGLVGTRAIADHHRRAGARELDARSRVRSPSSRR